MIITVLSLSVHSMHGVHDYARNQIRWVMNLILIKYHLPLINDDQHSYFAETKPLPNCGQVWFQITYTFIYECLNSE